MNGPSKRIMELAQRSVVLWRAIASWRDGDPAARWEQLVDDALEYMVERERHLEQELEKARSLQPVHLHLADPDGKPLTLVFAPKDHVRSSKAIKGALFAAIVEVVRARLGVNSHNFEDAIYDAITKALDEVHPPPPPPVSKSR